MRLFDFKALALGSAAMAVAATSGSMMMNDRPGAPLPAALEADARAPSAHRSGGAGASPRLTVASLPSSPWLYVSALFGLAAIGVRRR